MQPPKVLVTRKWPDNIEKILTKDFDCSFNRQDKPLTPSELKDALKTFDAILSTVTDSLTADILMTKPTQTKIIGNFGVGFNNIDIETAQQQNICVTNTPDVLTDCTADIAILLILMSARRGAEGDRLIRQKRWQGWSPTDMLGQKVTAKTLGIIGFGRIAQATAYKAHFGFNMKIIFYNTSPVPENLTQPVKAHCCGSIDDVLAAADFVSIHCPGSPQNHHLLGEQQLKRMRPNAHLINTARGTLIDTKALVKALQNNWFAGAGLDVFEHEPTIDPALLTLDNVTLLPHLGSATEETRRAMGLRVIDNIKAFFSGQTPRDLIC